MKNQEYTYIGINEIHNVLLELLNEFHIFCVNNRIEYYLIGGSALGARRHQGFIPWDDDIDVGMTRTNYEKFIDLIDNFNDKYKVENYRNTKNVDFVLTRIYFENYIVDGVNYTFDSHLNNHLYFDVFPLDNVPNDEKLAEKQKNRIKKLKKLLQYAYPRYYTGKHLRNFAHFFIKISLLPFRSRFPGILDNTMKKYSNENSKYICSMASQYSYDRQKIERSVYGVPTSMFFEDASYLCPQMIDEYLEKIYGRNYMELPSEDKRISTIKVRRVK